MKKSKFNKGFTLIELLLVIVILGTLASFMLIRLTGAQTGARDAKRKTDLKQYQTVIEAYRNDRGGYFPSRNTVQPISALCADTSLDTCPDDPSAPTTIYRYITNGTGIGNLDASEYVLWSKMEKPTTDVWFVICSDGQTGEVVTEPITSACPL